MSRIAILLFVACILVAGIAAKSTANFKKNAIADLFKERRANFKRKPAVSACVNLQDNYFCQQLALQGACIQIPQMQSQCASACNSC
uniref:U-actitoxin-Abu Potassium channel toxin type 1 Abutx n=1 Tax=Anthopleura buddemeieri TaxID=1566020 RepID=A0A3P8MJW0_9CNID|nr:U-actitoxin-Abu Potassium channel toxin type 1 Abutx [Anthopleura buddemeieri]